MARGLPGTTATRISAGPRSPDPYRVLIVDDEEKIRELYLQLLIRSGLDCVVDEAEDGLAAQAKVPVFRPHLIILDIVMPKLNGAQLCRWVRASGFADTKVLVTTANPSNGLFEQALEAGADDWLPKPMRIGEFIGKVSQMLAG